MRDLASGAVQDIVVRVFSSNIVGESSQSCEDQGRQHFTGLKKNKQRPCCAGREWIRVIVCTHTDTAYCGLQLVFNLYSSACVGVLGGGVGVGCPPRHQAVYKVKTVIWKELFLLVQWLEASTYLTPHSLLSDIWSFSDRDLCGNSMFQQRLLICVNACCLEGGKRLFPCDQHSAPRTWRAETIGFCWQLLQDASSRLLCYVARMNRDSYL